MVGLVHAHAQAAAPGAGVDRADAAVVVLLAAADEGVAGAVEGGAGGVRVSQPGRSVSDQEPSGGVAARSSAAPARCRRSRRGRRRRDGMPGAAAGAGWLSGPGRRRASRRPTHGGQECLAAEHVERRPCSRAARMPSSTIHQCRRRPAPGRRGRSLDGRSVPRWDRMGLAGPPRTGRAASGRGRSKRYWLCYRTRYTVGLYLSQCDCSWWRSFDWCSYCRIM